MSASSSQIQTTAGSLQVGGNLSVLGAQSSSFTGATFDGPVICQAPGTGLTVTNNEIVGGTLAVAGAFLQGAGGAVTLATATAGAASLLTMNNDFSQITIGQASPTDYASRICRIGPAVQSPQYVDSGGAVYASQGAFLGRYLGTFNQPFLVAPGSTGPIQDDAVLPIGGVVKCFFGIVPQTLIFNSPYITNDSIIMTSLGQVTITSGSGTPVIGQIQQALGTFGLTVISSGTSGGTVIFKWLVVNPYEAKSIV